jgi:hypothetical protein
VYNVSVVIVRVAKKIWRFIEADLKIGIVTQQHFALECALGLFLVTWRLISLDILVLVLLGVTA